MNQEVGWVEERFKCRETEREIEFYRRDWPRVFFICHFFHFPCKTRSHILIWKSYATSSGRACVHSVNRLIYKSHARFIPSTHLYQPFFQERSAFHSSHSIPSSSFSVRTVGRKLEQVHAGTCHNIPRSLVNN